MKPLEKMTLEELLQMIIDLKEEVKDSESYLESVKQELFKRFNQEIGDGPIFILYYPSDLESKEEIEAYLEQRHPGALLHKIDEDQNTLYAYMPAEYQKSTYEVEELGKIERRISNPSPKINLSRLKELDPAFYAKVVRQEDVFDDEKFGAILADDPDDVPAAFEQCIEGAKPKVSLHVTDLRK